MSDVRTVATGMAEVGDVQLADGSGVKLGADSKLRIPSRFGTALRGLRLEGTATFTVAPGQERRFIVRAGPASLTAGGTKFSVRAFNDENAVTVRVLEGDVAAVVGDSTVPLAAGASLRISKDSSMRAPTPEELEEALGWTDGVVVASDRSLREILVVAKRWFGLDLFVADTSMLERKVSLRADISKSKEAIASIEQSGGLQKVWEGSNMVLRDRPGRRAKAAGKQVP
jgi:ferric-dicitrate binding protein FerR (iron transport regulator)